MPDSGAYVELGNLTTDPDGYTGTVVAIKMCAMVRYDTHYGNSPPRYEWWQLTQLKPVQPTDSREA